MANTTKQAKKTVSKKATAAKKTTKASVSKVSAAEKKLDAALENAETTLRSARRVNLTEQANEAVDSLNARFEEVQNVARQFWLAGLGAVGKSVEEVQERYNKANEELKSRYSQISTDRQKLVQELVDRGEKVQDDAETRLKESRANIEEQIEVAKNRLTGLVSAVDIPARLQDVSDKLESLSKDLKKSA